MKTLTVISLLTLIALPTACGYSSKPAAPAPGSMPAIAQLNPDNATAGGAAFTLTVTGTNFGSKAVVNWNGVPQTSTAFVSGTLLPWWDHVAYVVNTTSVPVLRLDRPRGPRLAVRPRGRVGRWAQRLGERPAHG